MSLKTLKNVNYFQNYFDFFKTSQFEVFLQNLFIKLTILSSTWSYLVSEFHSFLFACEDKNSC